MSEVPSIIDHLTRSQETVQFTQRALQTLSAGFLDLAQILAEFELLNKKILSHQLTDRQRFEGEELELRRALASRMQQLLNALGDFKRDEGRPGIEYTRSFINYGKQMLFSNQLTELLDDKSYDMNDAFRQQIERFYNDTETMQKRIAARMLTLDRMSSALHGTRLAQHRAANLAVRHCIGEQLFPNQFFTSQEQYLQYLRTMKAKMLKNGEVMHLNASFALYLSLAGIFSFPSFGPQGFPYAQLTQQQCHAIAGRKFLNLSEPKSSELSKQVVIGYFSKMLAQHNAFITFGNQVGRLDECADTIHRTLRVIDVNDAYTVVEFLDKRDAPQ